MNLKCTNLFLIILIATSVVTGRAVRKQASGVRRLMAKWMETPSDTSYGMLHQ